MTPSVAFNHLSGSLFLHETAAKTDVKFIVEAKEYISRPPKPTAETTTSSTKHVSTTTSRNDDVMNETKLLTTIFIVVVIAVVFRSSHKVEENEEVRTRIAISSWK
jgi:hypothetical protein